MNALAQLGFVLLEQNQTAEAERTLRRAIAVNAGHFYANYDLGRLLVRTQRYAEAMPVLTHAASLKPQNSSVHYQLFLALSRLKRKDDADNELKIFKELEEVRKTRRDPQELADEEAQNPAPPLK